MTVPEIFSNNEIKAHAVESDDEEEDQDRDLVTSIDVQNKENKRNNIRKQIRE